MKVEKSVLSALRVHFENYLKSPMFSRVVSKVQTVLDEFAREKTSSGCFAFK